MIRHDDNIHTITRMTGNKNNILRLALSEIPCVPKIIVLTLPGEENIVNIRANEIKQYVEQGIDAIFKKYNRKFYVSEIHFCQSDSPPVDIYEFMTFKLLEDIVNKN